MYSNVYSTVERTHQLYKVSPSILLQFTALSPPFTLQHLRALHHHISAMKSTTATITTLLPLLAAAAAVVASPLLKPPQNQPRQQPWPYPPWREEFTSFTLVANITDLAKAATLFPDFDTNHLPQHWSVEGGQDRDAVLRPATASRPATTFWVNGTSNDITDHTTSIAAPPLVYYQSGRKRRFAYGLQFWRGGYGPASIAVKLHSDQPADLGAGVEGFVRDPIARVSHPFAGGPKGPAHGFMVCKGMVHPNAYFGGREAARGFSEGGLEKEVKRRQSTCEPEPEEPQPEFLPRVLGLAQDEVVPDDCVEMSLLAQCEGGMPMVAWDDIRILNFQVQNARCYVRVKDIDWALYSDVM